ADRERQYVRLGSERAGFVDQRDAGRVRQAREVAGGRRLADADETYVVVLERARRCDGHHLVRLVVGHRHYSAAARCLCAYLAKSSGPFSRTFVFIQARKESRSFAIESHSL